MRKFLWNDNKGKKKMNLLKWGKLCRRKKYDGLGMKSLMHMNKALLTKLQWIFATEKGVLLRDIIEEKYGDDLNGWFSKIPKNTYGRNKKLKIAEIFSEEANIWNLQIPRRLNSAERMKLN